MAYSSRKPGDQNGSQHAEMLCVADKVCSTATDLVFDPLVVARHFYERFGHEGLTLSTEAAVYLACTLDYMAAEALELSGNAAKQGHCGADGPDVRIEPVHVHSAVARDEELCHFVNGRHSRQSQLCGQFDNIEDQTDYQEYLRASLRRVHDLEMVGEVSETADAAVEQQPEENSSSEQGDVSNSEEEEDSDYVALVCRKYRLREDEVYHLVTAEQVLNDILDRFRDRLGPGYDGTGFCDLDHDDLCIFVAEWDHRSLLLRALKGSRITQQEALDLLHSLQAYLQWEGDCIREDRMLREACRSVQVRVRTLQEDVESLVLQLFEVVRTMRETFLPYVLRSSGVSSDDELNVEFDLDKSALENRMAKYQQLLDWKTDFEASSDSEQEEAACCPITNDIFRDPVLASDGHCYERSALLEWLATNTTSPLTRKKLVQSDLRPVPPDVQRTVEAAWLFRYGQLSDIRCSVLDALEDMSSFMEQVAHASREMQNALAISKQRFQQVDMLTRDVEVYTPLSLRSMISMMNALTAAHKQIDALAVEHPVNEVRTWMQIREICAVLDKGYDTACIMFPDAVRAAIANGQLDGQVELFMETQGNVFDPPDEDMIDTDSLRTYVDDLIGSDDVDSADERPTFSDEALHTLAIAANDFLTDLFRKPSEPPVVAPASSQPS
jgi:hypothetical protein